MHVINLDKLQLPDGWHARADSAKAKGVDKISENGGVWRELKGPLKALSHDKCYYCEIIQERSDGAVDHFRPKKDYPWSAFSPENYRFSCTYCNSRRTDEENNRTGGKGEYFPLLDESKRASNSTDEVSESPVLIDPCNPNEPGLIDFDETGAPMPTYSSDEHATRCKRAEISIRLYHLDHPDIVDRRKTLAISISRKIRIADRLFPLTEAGDGTIDASFSEHVRYLADCVSENAELSAFARKIIAGHRHIRWVDALLRSA